MPSENCPKRDELVEFALGKLPQEAIEAVTDHVESCLECQSRVAELDHVSDDLVAQLRDQPPHSPFAAESELQQALARAIEAGRQPSLSGAKADESASKESPELGRFGEYRLLERIAQGGMGTVYKALHTEMERVVALKVLPRGHVEDDQAIARFKREIRAVARLNHPHIVQAYDAREVDEGRILVMEYVEGLDLSELVRRCGALRIADACELARQAAAALHYAHKHGLIHRDIKPSNLMLTRSGQVKILDLGLALLEGQDAAAASELTDEGQVMGTLDYMAPEQATDSHQVDLRADIYGLGATLYKLLCGEAPFSGPKYNTLPKKATALATDPVRPIRERRPDVPESLSAALDRMLAKRPEERYATAAEVATELGAFVSGCDLIGLLRDAGATAKPAAKGEGSLVGTSQLASSALVGTEPSQPAQARRRKLRLQYTSARLGCAIAVTVLGVLVAAIVISIIKNGRKWTIHPPAGSNTTIDEKGNVDVVLAPTDQTQDVRPKGEKEPPVGVRPRPGKEVLLEESFAGPEPSLPEGWRIARGSWKVEGGALAAYMDQPYYPGFLFAPAASWRDYAVECDVRCDQAVAGIVFRHNHEDRFYCLTFRHEESNRGFHEFPLVQFEQYVPRQDKRLGLNLVYSGTTIAHAQKNYELSRKKYHRVRVEVVGNKMRAFVDDELILSAEDDEDVLWSGSIGLLAADQCFKPGIAFFRNLRVESLDSVLRAAWEFDEGSGTAANDGSGNGNHAVLQGNVQWVDGRNGKAVMLDGVDDLLRVPDNPSQSGMGQLTIRALLKMHSFPKTETTIVRKWDVLHSAWDPDTASYILAVREDGRLRFLAQRGFNLHDWSAFSEAIPAEKWVEIAAIYDGIRNTLYTRVEGGSWIQHEGTPLPSTARGFIVPDTDEPIEIGYDPHEGSFLNATIDRIRLFAEAQHP
jgi:serine/threonine protein kinase